MIEVWASGAVPLEAWKRIFDKLRQQGLDAVYLAMGNDIANLELYYDGVLNMVCPIRILPSCTGNGPLRTITRAR